MQTCNSAAKLVEKGFRHAVVGFRLADGVTPSQMVNSEYRRGVAVLFWASAAHADCDPAWPQSR